MNNDMNIDNTLHWNADITMTSLTFISELSSFERYESIDQKKRGWGNT